MNHQTYILTIDAEHQPESEEITGALIDLLREKRGDSREIIGVGLVPKDLYDLLEKA